MPEHEGREQTEAAERYYETRYHQLFENASDIVYTLDLAGNITSVNRAAEAASGYTRDELSTMNIEDIVVPDDLPLAREMLSRKLEGGAATTYELRLRGRHGQTAVLEVSSHLLTEGGRPVGIQGIGRDVTSRKWREGERERLLRWEQNARIEAEAAQQRFAFLAEATQALASSLDGETMLSALAPLMVPFLADWCCVHVLEADGRVRQVALAHPRGQEELAQTLRAEPVEPSLESLVRSVARSGEPQLASDVEAEPRAKARATDTWGTWFLGMPGPATVPEEPSETQTASPEHRGLFGTLEPRSYMIVPLQGRGGVLSTLSLLATDSGRRYNRKDLVLAVEVAHRAALMVDNARLHHELQQVLRTRDQFLSLAAHELKTPVATIRAYLELMKDWQGDARNEIETRALEAMERQGARLQRLVQELIEVSRLQLGRLNLHLRQFDLSEVASQTVDQLRPVNPSHRLLLHQEGTTIVKADRYRIEQVLLNLLSNAIKFSAEGGDVEVSVTRDDGEVIVSVKDRGIGIPLEAQQHLFEQFYRAHGDTEHDYGGTGLGLHLSRELVLRHGGRLWFESTPGQGATFSFGLPAAAPIEETRGGR